MRGTRLVAAVGLLVWCATISGAQAKDPHPLRGLFLLATPDSTRVVIGYQALTKRKAPPAPSGANSTVIHEVVRVRIGSIYSAPSQVQVEQDGVATGEVVAPATTLDPAVEVKRLPMDVSVLFNPNSRAPFFPLGGDGRVDQEGWVSISLHNRAAAFLGFQDVIGQAASMAPILDRYLEASKGPPGARLPAAGIDLPPSFLGVGSTTIRRYAAFLPLRVQGTVVVDGGPMPDLNWDKNLGEELGVTRLKASGRRGSFSALVLSRAPQWTFRVHPGNVVRIDLTATPVLDPGAVTPPDGHGSWAEWAGSNPSELERAKVTHQLMVAAGEAAVGAKFVPYLATSAAPGSTTSFRFQNAAAAAEELHPHHEGVSLGPLLLALAAGIVVGAIPVGVLLSAGRRGRVTG